MTARMTFDGRLRQLTTGLCALVAALVLLHAPPARAAGDDGPQFRLRVAPYGSFNGVDTHAPSSSRDKFGDLEPAYGVVGGEVELGWEFLPFLSFDASLRLGFNDVFELMLGGGATVRLPYWVSPYAKLHLGYGYVRIPWENFPSSGDDNAHTLFARGEAGVGFRLTERFELNLGVFMTTDLLRGADRSVDEGADDPFEMEPRTSNLSVHDVGALVGFTVRF